MLNPMDAVQSSDQSPASSRWFRPRRPVGPLAATNASYGVVYAIDGAMLPFLAVFLAREHDLGPSEIGLIIAVGGAMAVLTPFVVSVLADSRLRAGRLLLLLLLASGIALTAFPFIEGYWSALALYAVFSLVREPTRPLLDGIFFSSQRSNPAMASVSYHRVRFWGTFGYMIPGIVLFLILSNDGSLGVVPLTAAAFAVLAILITRYLPDATPGIGQAAVARPNIGQTVRAAGRLVRRPKIAGFLVAMFLLETCAASYASFYPLLATDVAGLPIRWLGIVTNAGVLIELIYIAGFGWMVAKLGWRRFMVVGAGVTALRVALLAVFPSVGIVVGTQALHGMVIAVQMIAARIILDKQTTDEIRHSTQGLYTMVVIGGGRIVGSALGGLVAAQSFAAVFWSAAAAATVAGLILFWALSDLRET